MKTFKDIRKGDRIRWRAGGPMDDAPERIIEGIVIDRDPECFSRFCPCSRAGGDERVKRKKVENE